MAAWSQLPVDLLGLVLQKLTVADHLRFAAVCPTWNSAVRSKSFLPKPQSPWLMFLTPEPGPIDPIPVPSSATANFLSLSESRIYTIPLPQPSIRHRLCIGSAHGWLVTVCPACQLHLLNPLTGVQIQLPPITTLPFVTTFNQTGHLVVNKKQLLNDPKSSLKRKIKGLKAEESVCSLREFFGKAVLSSAPSSDGSGDFVVMLLHNPGGRLAFTSAGAGSWTALRAPYGFADIVLHKEQIYTLSLTGLVDAWKIKDGFADIRRHTNPHDYLGFTFRPRFIAKGRRVSSGFFPYLIEDVTGSLLLLTRDHMTDNLPDYRVYLLSEEKCKWVLQKHMKDNVLFFDNYNAFSVSAAEFSGLIPKSIYFVDNNYNDFSERHESRGVGVFDMQEKTMESLGYFRPHATSPPPIWINPTLC